MLLELCFSLRNIILFSGQSKTIFLTDYQSHHFPLTYNDVGGLHYRDDTLFHFLFPIEYAVYTLVWPCRDVKAGERATRDFFQTFNVSHELMMSFFRSYCLIGTKVLFVAQYDSILNLTSLLLIALTHGPCLSFSTFL